MNYGTTEKTNPTTQQSNGDEKRLRLVRLHPSAGRFFSDRSLWAEGGIQRLGNEPWESASPILRQDAVNQSGELHRR